MLSQRNLCQGVSGVVFIGCVYCYGPVSVLTICMFRSSSLCIHAHIPLPPEQWVNPKNCCLKPSRRHPFSSHRVKMIHLWSPPGLFVYFSWYMLYFGWCANTLSPINHVLFLFVLLGRAPSDAPASFLHEGKGSSFGHGVTSWIEK